MNILILVLSYNESPYRELMLTQQQTFDSIEIEGVKTVYYHGGAFDNDTIKLAVRHSNPNSSWERVEFQCTDSYYYMSQKLKMCLDYVFDERFDFKWDVIFRSNSSSYISKQRLKEFASTLPTEKLYAGWEIDGNAGYSVCSGAGFFLSRDTSEILREKIDPTFEREEDVYCAQLLHDAGIKIIDDKSRYDVPITIPDDFPKNLYHYRLKSGPANRLADIGNMRAIHKLINP